MLEQEQHKNCRKYRLVDEEHFQPKARPLELEHLARRWMREGLVVANTRQHGERRCPHVRILRWVPVKVRDVVVDTHLAPRLFLRVPHQAIEEDRHKLRTLAGKLLHQVLVVREELLAPVVVAFHVHADGKEVAKDVLRDCELAVVDCPIQW